MGNSLSTSNLLPTTLSQCIESNGEFSAIRYFHYKRQQQAEVSAEEIDAIIEELVLQANAELEEEKNRSTGPGSRAGKRKCFRRQINRVRLADGTIAAIAPTHSTWYTMYVSSPDLENKKFNDRFIRRFRCCYSSFLKLLDKLKNDIMFQRWMNRDAVGRDPSPIELLLLGALRYLGRGWTFDDLEEATSISEECHRQFLHVFIFWASTVFYEEQISLPRSVEEAAISMKEYEAAGMHGCVGSVDATHILMIRCPYTRANQHRGFKETGTARTYNLTVNHNRRILCSTRGHPSTWNDKTVCMYDELSVGLHKGTILNDVNFELLERSANEETIRMRKYQGCWLVCDNGYHDWSTLIPPFKNYEAIHTKILRWSQWIESMRKDVECTFGIMKGRFRILKTGVRVHGIEVVDRVWLSCCALHNYLLTSRHERENEIDWTGPIGDHDSNDIVYYYNIQQPFAILRLEDPDAFRRLDLSGMGNGATTNADQQDVVQEPVEVETILDNNNNNYEMVNGTTAVFNLSQAYFRTKLVEHFDILYEQKKIKWPSRPSRR